MRNPKMREVETDHSTALVIGGTTVILTVMAFLIWTHIFDLWPDWMIEFELLVRAAIKAWLK